MLTNPLVAHDRAAHAVTDQDHMPANRAAKNQVVKRGHVVEFICRHLQESSDLHQSFVGDPSPMLLDDPQRFDAHGTPLFIARKFDFNLSFFFFAQHCRIFVCNRSSI